MSVPTVIPDSPRRERSALGRFLVFSALIHSLLFLQFEVLRLAALKFPDRVPQWVRDLVLTPDQWARQEQQLAKEREKETDVDSDPHLTFVEVEPSTVTAEEPPKTPYYSTANTLAANPKPAEKPATQPEFDGKQTQSVRTFSNDRPDPAAIVPPAPVEETPPNITPVEKPPEIAQQKPVETPTPTPTPTAKEKVEARPQGGPKTGDYAVAKPVPQAETSIPQSARTAQVPKVEPTAESKPKPRPKTLAEKRASKGILVGEKMRQEGGVERLNVVSALNVKASPFGDYDRQMMGAIQHRWYALLEEGRFANDGTGKVVVKFKLKSDGSIHELSTVERTVTERLAFVCESAIIEPALYTPWPSELKAINGSDVREVTFTFYYN